MKKLFGSLSDSLGSLMTKEQDPTRDARSAEAWLREVRKSDVQSQLQMVAEMVGRFAAQSAQGLDHLNALMELDSGSRLAFDMLCQQYIQNPRMGKQIEETLWKAIMHHARSMVAAYHRFVRLEEHKPEEESGFNQIMPLVIARSLRYLGVQVKWHLCRFETPPMQLWAGANQLYRLSEVLQADVTNLQLYPQIDNQQSTCADEYLRTQMLSTLNNGNFSARQYEWADRWMGLWSGHVQIERKYRDNYHQYCVNLSDAASARKIHDSVTGDMLRFWGVVDLLQEMNRVMQAHEAGESPVRLQLGDDVRMPGCLEFLRQLEILWSRERGRNEQRQARLAVSKEVEIAHGLGDIFHVVHLDDDEVIARKTLGREVEADEVADMQMYGRVTERTRAKMQSRQQAFLTKERKAVIVRWTVENQSQGGFGVKLPLAEHEWVRLGVLLAARPDADSTWLIAVVRRINRQSDTELFAGVQVLSATPLAVSMKSDQLASERGSMTMAVSGEETSGFAAPMQALYIPFLGSDERRHDSLMMYSVDFHPHAEYEVSARDKHFRVQMGDIIEKGVDWVWCFAQVQR